MFIGVKRQIHKLVFIIFDISTKINDVDCHEKSAGYIGYEVLEEVFSEATLIPRLAYGE